MQEKRRHFLNVFPSQHITHENGCFKTQTRNWKWSRDTRFWAENLTCICIKQPQTFKYLFWTQCQEKRNSLFRSFCQKQIFVFDAMTEKGNFFFPDIVSKTNISAKTHKKKIPFFGHVVQDKNLLFHPVDQLNTILFYCTWHFFPWCILMRPSKRTTNGNVASGAEK